MSCFVFLLVLLFFCELINAQMCGLVNCTINQRCDPSSQQCVCDTGFGGPLCEWPRFRLNNSLPLPGFVGAGNQTYYQLDLSKAVSLLTFQISITTGAPLVSIKQNKF